MMVAVMDMMFLIGQSRLSVITLIAPVRTKGHPAAMRDYSTKKWAFKVSTSDNFRLYVADGGGL